MPAAEQAAHFWHDLPCWMGLVLDISQAFTLPPVTTQTHPCLWVLFLHCQETLHRVACRKPQISRWGIEEIKYVSLLLCLNEMARRSSENEAKLKTSKNKEIGIHPCRVGSGRCARPLPLHQLQSCCFLLPAAFLFFRIRAANNYCACCGILSNPATPSHITCFLRFWL